MLGCARWRYFRFSMSQLVKNNSALWSQLSVVNGVSLQSVIANVVKPFRWLSCDYTCKSDVSSFLQWQCTCTRRKGQLTGKRHELSFLPSTCRKEDDKGRSDYTEQRAWRKMSDTTKIGRHRISFDVLLTVYLSIILVPKGILNITK